MRCATDIRERYGRVLLLAALFVLVGSFLTGGARPRPANAAGATDTPPQPDAGLAVPWDGVVWQSMPELTWAACGVSSNTRKVIDLALGQWSYAATNQGIPVHFSELPCTDGQTTAQIAIFEASASDLGQLAVPADVDVFGLTLARDASDRICGIDVTGPCVAKLAHIYLFTDNWQNDGLTFAQAAKTTAHELGHAVGLGHAHFCTYDSIMAQDCEPIFQGLGSDDVQSVDALVDYDRAYFGEQPLAARATLPSQAGGGMTVTYPAGYNLVAGPRGTSFAAATSPLFAFLPGDTAYESFPASQSAYNGYGYWAYFPHDVTVQLGGSGGTFYTVDVSPGQWALIGNENGAAPMRVTGADALEVFDPQLGQYRAATALQPGQAGWVEAGQAGQIVVASTMLTQEQIACFLDLGSPATCSNSG